MHPENVDFTIMDKPAGNAHPPGVIILSGKIMEEFIGGSHPMPFSTSGGNTVAPPLSDINYNISTIIIFYWL